ncbi:MAG: hypothetical protein MZV65_29340 [Chromatiales bacterium]|nr:hypothetical protein [Chromatiales bacterium]
MPPLDPKTALDVYVAKLDPTLSQLQAYTVLGSPNYADIGSVMRLARDPGSPGCIVYVAGRTYSPDFPVTAGAYDTSFNSAASGTADGYVARLTEDLQLVAATFIGGSQEETQSHWLDFDYDGNIYFGGKTASVDFPATPGAYDRTYNGGVWDAYVAKLSPDLSTLLAATLFGGINEDVTRNARLDGYGNLFFTGQTLSPDLPVTSGAYDKTYHGDRDFYVAKLNNDFSTLLAATYVGGTSADFPSYLRVDKYGYVNVVGYTQSPEFPTTTGVYDRTHAGLFDGVVVRMDPKLTKIVKSTFFGGSDVDLAFTFDLDAYGNFYITGRTRSPDYPTTAGAYDRTWNGNFDAYVTVLDYNLKTLKASTYLGGAGLDMAFAIMWDHANTVYLAGVSGSADFPITANAYDKTFVPTNTAFALKIDLSAQ